MTDAERTRIVGLLVRDLTATVGGGHEPVVSDTATHVLEFANDLLEFERRLVDEVQQYSTGSPALLPRFDALSYAYLAALG